MRKLNDPTNIHKYCANAPTNIAFEPNVRMKVPGNKE